MTAASPILARPSRASLAETLRASTPALLFGLRLWASVCLSFYVAFKLELSEPSWAATTAVLVCQPVLGASLRKSLFRMVGTVIGAIGIVVLAAFFRQDRVSFLVGLALWCAASAFVATLLRNFAAYAAALAGYTAAIIAIDVLGPIGTAGGSVTMFAIYRTAEICIGIVCAGVVLALTDLGHSRRKLAAEFAALSSAVMNGFADCFLAASSNVAQFRALRHDLLRRVIALDPMIDAAVGELSDLRYRSAALQRAVSGLMETITAWRKVAFEIELNASATTGEANAVHAELPRDRLPPGETASTSEPAELREACCAAARRLTRFNAQTPTQRLLADNAAIGMLGLAKALNGLTGVIDPRETVAVRGTARLRVADWLPAFINALRAFLSFGAISLFWIGSAWPSGVSAIAFCAVIVILLPLQGDLAYSASMTFLQGTTISATAAAVVAFGILPRATTFPSLCLVLGIILVPFGFLTAFPWRHSFLFVAASFNFVPMLSITNAMSYDAAQFWNSAIAILAGVAFGTLAMLVIPPLSPAIRTDRLLALTLADLRRFAKRTSPGSQDDWESRNVGRLLAMPDQTEPHERDQLAAAVAVGKEMVRLQRVAPRFVSREAVDAALLALADGRSTEAIERFKAIDRLLAALPRAGRASRVSLSLRASILVICGQLSEFGPYFDERLGA